MSHANHYKIMEGEEYVIIENTIDGYYNYTRSAEKIGCAKHP